MVYTSESIALATLEVLVHLNESSLLTAYVLRVVEFDAKLVSRLDRSSLPPNWSDHPAPSELQFLGDAWISERRSAVLQVPSAIVPSESNYLLNPEHPDFRKLALDDPIPFRPDPRLARLLEG